MLMYGELADWWPLISAPEDYLEEVESFLPLLSGAKSILELGSGGGNNATHLKKHAALTLVDASAEMVAVSRRLNPDLEHHVGDMRTVRLARTFDAVFIHDAIMYMRTPADFDAAIETASLHCRPGGTLLVVPDATLETFEPSTDHGGHDGDGRGVRYLEWVHPREGRNFVTDYVFALRGADGATRVLHDRHHEGLLSTAEWLETLSRWGFTAHFEMDRWERPVFVSRRS